MVANIEGGETSPRENRRREKIYQSREDQCHADQTFTWRPESADELEALVCVEKRGDTEGPGIRAEEEMIQITFEPDMNIEPGRQWIVLPCNDDGAALAQLLTSDPVEDGLLLFDPERKTIRVQHNEIVDRNIVELINILAHARFSAPRLVQLTMEESGS